MKAENMELSTSVSRKAARIKFASSSLKIFINICIISGVFILIQNQVVSLRISHSASAHRTDSGWLQCIVDIQKKIEDSYKDVFLERKYHEKDIIYIDPAQHQNLGDAFLVAGTTRLLVRFGFSPQNIYTCKESQANLLSDCKYDTWLPKEKFLAIWHGGGNWGDGWHVHQPRLRSMKKLILESNATIVSFPQSVYYLNQEKEFNDAEKLNGWIKNTTTSSRLVLSFRQANQIQSAKSFYTHADVRLVPDIAFMIGPLLSSKTIWTAKKNEIDVPSVDMIFLLRKDKESSMDCTSVERALKTLRLTNPSLERRLKNLTYQVSDWEGYEDVYQVRNFKEDDAMLKVEAGRNLLSLGKVVVTDRLHSSILALLMHKPHVFIEQSYGKISNTRNTAFAASEHCNEDTLMFHQSYDLEDAIESALKFL